MKPEPSELVLRGCMSLPPPFGPPPPRRFLKKSSKNSSNGEPGGNCGTAPRSPPPPLASTVCEVEMLTTASITFSAMSAMPSGPRAQAGAAASMVAAPSETAAPIRRRRRLKAGLAPVMSASLQRIDLRATVRPNGSEAQAFEPDISAKNRPSRAHDFVAPTALSGLLSLSFRDGLKDRTSGAQLRLGIRDSRNDESTNAAPARPESNPQPPSRYRPPAKYGRAWLSRFSSPAASRPDLPRT